MTMTDLDALVTPPADAEVVETRVEFWLERRVVGGKGLPGPWRSAPPAQPFALPPFYTMAKAVMEDRAWQGSQFQYRIVRYVISGVVYRDSGLPETPEVKAPETKNLPDPK